MKRFTLAALTLVVCAGAQAASEEVKMNLVTSQDRSVHRDGENYRNG